MTSLYIHRLPDLVRVLLLEDKRPVELHVAPKSNVLDQGTIVMGRMLRIVPSMNAAFVDIGQALPGFLPWHHTLAYGQPPSEPQKAMGQIYQPGQSVVVQIHHVSQGNKGAKLQEQIQYPGTYVLWSPYGQRAQISRKLKDHPKAPTLFKLAQQLQCQLGGSLTLRTAASQGTEQEIVQDGLACQTRSQAIQKMAESAFTGQVLATPGDLGQWAIRELWQPGKMILWCNDGQDRTLARERLAQQNLDPHLTLKFWPAPAALPDDVASWQTYMQQALAPTVRLPGGAWLAIEPTEGMFTIDVNGGRHQGAHDREQTALAINLQACREIARQIRLRNMGGICVIDFITLAQPAHREQIRQALAKHLAQERIPVRMEPFEPHCVMILHRKRTRPSLAQQVQHPCPHCQGQGRVPQAFWQGAMVMDQIYREQQLHPGDIACVNGTMYNILQQHFAQSLQHIHQAIAPLDGQGTACTQQQDHKSPSIVQWQHQPVITSP